jgi:hypothetical protein
VYSQKNIIASFIKNKKIKENSLETHFDFEYCCIPLYIRNNLLYPTQQATFGVYRNFLVLNPPELVYRHISACREINQRKWRR